MILKMGRMSKISILLLVSPVGKSIKTWCALSSPSPFPTCSPMNNTEPADGCHQCCIQHKFLQAFRRRLTQLTSGFSFSCHPDLLHFPIPNWLTRWWSPSCSTCGCFHKLKLSGLAWPTDTHGTRVLLPGTGMSVCVFPKPKASPASQCLPCRPSHPCWLRGWKRTCWAAHCVGHTHTALVS